jgi:hypothetical protein
MLITINPKEPIEVIETKILRSFQSKLNSATHRAAPAIRERIRDACGQFLKGSNEYQSILKGELLAELGIPDVAHRLEGIVDAIKNGVEVSAVPVQIRGRKLYGGLVLKMIRRDFEDLLQLAEAKYISQPSREEIPWLKWLIVEGDAVIILNYHVLYDLSPEQRLRSRTGMAVMRPQAGASWRVPPEYSGTLDDNWITRAFDGAEVEKAFGRIIADEILLRV